MSRVCEICGKGRVIGNHETTRGRAKHLKGVGTKVTGITRREFRVNLQNVRITTENGTSKTVRVCTQCMRCGAVTKRINSEPFKMIEKAEKAASK